MRIAKTKKASRPMRRDKRNCGTGAGGFQPGNDCAKGGGGGESGGGSSPQGGSQASGGTAGSSSTPVYLKNIGDAADRAEFVTTALALSRAYDNVDRAQSDAQKARREGDQKLYRQKLAEAKSAQQQLDSLQARIDSLAERHNIDPDYAFEAVVTLVKEGTDISDYKEDPSEQMKMMEADESESEVDEGVVTGVDLDESDMEPMEELVLPDVPDEDPVRDILDRFKDKYGSRSVEMDRRCACAQTKIRGNVVSGIAVPYGTDSQGLPFVETIKPGAFADDIGKRNVALLVEHDGKRILADTRSGTLVLRETRRGVEFRAKLPQTRDGRDMRALLRDGIYRHMSFGFVATRDSWKGERRSVEKAQLFEISLVHTPAYEATAAAVRGRSNVDLVGRFLRLRLGAMKNESRFTD